MHRQPDGYTELTLDAAPGFTIPLQRRSCADCAHAEPFKAAVMVAWCSRWGGHVPAGASCDTWQAPPFDAS